MALPQDQQHPNGKNRASTTSTECSKILKKKFPQILCSEGYGYLVAKRR